MRLYGVAKALSVRARTAHAQNDEKGAARPSFLLAEPPR